MSDIDLWRLSMELELDDLTDEESKVRLLGCIKKGPTKKKSEDKCIDICEECGANDWEINQKEQEQVCQRCGTAIFLKEHCKLEYNPNRGVLQDYTVLGQETIEGKALPSNIIELQRIQREQDKRLAKGKKKSSVKQPVKQRIMNDIGVELKKIYKGGPPEDIVLKLGSLLLKIEISYKDNDSSLPRGDRRKALYAIMLWYISGGEWGNIIKYFNTFSSKILKEVIEILVIIVDDLEFTRRIQNINRTDISVQRCFSDIKQNLKDLKTKLGERFDELDKNEIHMMSVGLYLLKTTEGKEVYKDFLSIKHKKGNIGDILRKCGVEESNINRLAKKFGEISKWFGDENIWNQIT